LLALLALGVAGCGGSSSSASHSTTTAAVHHHAPATRPRPTTLLAAGSLALPSAREGTATAPFGGGSIIVSGGQSAAGTSTSTVFRLDPLGHAGALAPLPGPIHDAAAAEVAGRLLTFGGGQFEGSDRIIQVLPGQPRQVGTLPQALSDLDAAVIGSVAYVAGGWNGSVTNPDIYAAQPTGGVTRVGTLPIGVRYPAVGALAGKLVVAGGETTAGTPTTTASMFDPATDRVTPLPALPVATDHAAGAVLNGRFYLIGGLRDGVFTDAIISWAPGEPRWRPAGHLPTALADLAAAPFDGGIAVVGGRGAAGTVATGTLLKPT
jgi:serine/threonine-protein kinase PknK